MQIRNFITLFIIAGLVIGPAYAKKDKSKQLPPGLQKKVSRGEQLPPGWDRKISKGSRLDKAVYQHGHVVKTDDLRGEIIIRVDDRLLRLHKATREIIDILK